MTNGRKIKMLQADYFSIIDNYFFRVLVYEIKMGMCYYLQKKNINNENKVKRICYYWKQIHLGRLLCITFVNI